MITCLPHSPVVAGVVSSADVECTVAGSCEAPLPNLASVQRERLGLITCYRNEHFARLCSRNSTAKAIFCNTKFVATRNFLSTKKSEKITATNDNLEIKI